MIRNKQDLLTIKQFAALCRTTTRTVRFYADKNLLKPTKVDASTGYRYYHPDQVRHFFQIKLLQTFEIPLKNIKQSMRKSSKIAFFQDELQQLKIEIEEKEKKYAFLTDINTFLNEEASVEKLTKKELIPGITILAIKKTGIAYSALTPIIQELFSLAHEQNISFTGGIFVGYLKPDQYQPKGSDLEIGIVLKDDRKVDLGGDYYIRKIPAHQALTYLYQGPYEYLTFIHQKLFYSEYFKKFSFHGQPYDLEICGPTPGVSVYDYQTKIVYPLK